MKNFIKTSFNGLKTNTFFANFLNLSTIQLSNVLLQIAFFPIVIHIVGLTDFGFVTLFSSYAALGGMFVNYGTSQSGVKDVAIYRNDARKLSLSFYTILFLRGILFLLYIVLTLALMAMKVPHIVYFTLAGSMVLAEVLNPLFFFIGIEKLSLYNIFNIGSKILTIALVLLFVRGAEQAPLVNFFVGITNCLAYFILILILVRKYKLKYRLPSVPRIFKHFKSNSYLLGNNLSVQLQQSLFLFMLSWTGNSLILGVYSIGDKIVWSCRLLLMAISNAVFSNGAVIYLKESVESWRIYKKHLTLITGSVFLLGSFILMIFAELIIKILTGNEDASAVMYLRAMAFAPFLASLNVFNVLELLYKGDNRRIFLIAMMLLAVSAIFTSVLVFNGNQKLFGYYLPFMDLIALLLYTYTIKKST